MLKLFVIFSAQNNRLSIAFGARTPVPSKSNLALWNSALEHYSDRIVADFLAFGWPINYHAAAFPEPSSSNHFSAVRFPDTIDAMPFCSLR